MNFNKKLSDLYWYFKDRKLVTNFNREPDCYFLYLPRYTEKTFVDIYIKAGALSEKEELVGIGHLLEHYISELVNKGLPDDVRFEARINDYYIVFYLESSDNKNLICAIEKFFETIANPDFSRQEIFDYEKKSIINELENEKNDTELKLERLIERTRYSDEPNRRSFVDHLPRLKYLKIEDIAAYHKKIFTKENLKVFVSSTKLNPRVCDVINDKLGQLNLPNGSVNFPKPAYSSFQVQISDEPDMSGNYVAMTFPSIGRSESLRDNMIFELMAEVMRDKERKGIRQKIREAGIYDFSVAYSQGIYNGYLSIQSHLNKEQVVPWVEMVSGMIRELKKGKLDLLLLKKTKKKRAGDMLVSWRNNEGRFNILTRFILDQKDIPSHKTVKKMIASVSESDIRAMAQKIFDKEKMNLIIFGETVVLNQEKLERAVVF
ncbi:MAG: insulinase family protein [Patescibacteria group bacterium]|nr:insulinase family protein [Patescibacteria group bacterium]